MTEISTSEKNIPWKKMMKWGWFLLLAPIIGIITIFFWWTLVGLLNNILWWATEATTEVDPVWTIIEFVKSLLTLFGLICTFWWLSLSPVGLILLVIGYIKKRKNTVTTQ